MRMSRWALVFVALVSLGLCSCEGSIQFKELVGPVTGTVLIDGKPVQGVFVSAKPKVADNANYTQSTAETNAEGKFSLQTYNPGDGAPPGEYSLVFKWRQGTNDDLFNGRYADPANSVKTFKLEQQPLDLGKIELTSK